MSSKLSCYDNVKRKNENKRPPIKKNDDDDDDSEYEIIEETTTTTTTTTYYEEKEQSAEEQFWEHIMNNLYETPNEQCNCGIIQWCGICNRKLRRKK